MRASEEDRFDALLQAFRDACPAPEPDPNFMPHLWSRIEARRMSAFSFQRMANALVTAAVAACICLGVYTTLHRSDTQYSQSYVEALAAANAIDSDLAAPVRLEIDQAPVK